MTKTFPLFALVFILLTTACKSAAPHSTLEPAPAISATPVLEQNLPPAESSTAEPETAAEQTVSAPVGLRIVYIREGNLWSWTEAGGNVQLIGSGDLSTVRLSDDGQLLAIMRGREVWTIRMDGTDARLLATEKDVGGALWFAPNETQLAVSTKDQIDVIDLKNGRFLTVMTYPALPENYYPEVIWSPEAFGFKTVIPPQAVNGRAELHFVFTDGTVGSLAKFALVSLSESLPFLSPDGGYLIYVEKMGDGKESLYLMDSSGTTKPYGEAAASVRALAWLPDSKHFFYRTEDPAHTLLGNIAGSPVEIALENYQTIRWVNMDHFLGLQDGNLYLSNMAGGRTLIDMLVADFDS